MYRKRFSSCCWKVLLLLNVNLLKSVNFSDTRHLRAGCMTQTGSWNSVALCEYHCKVANMVRIALPVTHLSSYLSVVSLKKSNSDRFWKSEKWNMISLKYKDSKFSMDSLFHILWNNMTCSTICHAEHDIYSYIWMWTRWVTHLSFPLMI